MSEKKFKLMIKVIGYFTSIYLNTVFSFSVVSQCVIDEFHEWGEITETIDNGHGKKIKISRDRDAAVTIINTRSGSLNYLHDSENKLTRWKDSGKLSGYLEYRFDPCVPLLKASSVAADYSIIKLNFSEIRYPFSFQLILTDKDENRCESHRINCDNNQLIYSVGLSWEAMKNCLIDFSQLESLKIIFFPQENKEGSYFALKAISIVSSKLIIPKKINNDLNTGVSPIAQNIPTAKSNLLNRNDSNVLNGSKMADSKQSEEAKKPIKVTYNRNSSEKSEEMYLSDARSSSSINNNFVFNLSSNNRPIGIIHRKFYNFIPYISKEEMCSQVRKNKLEDGVLVDEQYDICDTEISPEFLFLENNLRIAKIVHEKVYRTYIDNSDDTIRLEDIRNKIVKDNKLILDANNALSFKLISEKIYIKSKGDKEGEKNIIYEEIISKGERMKSY